VVTCIISIRNVDEVASKTVIYIATVRCIFNRTIYYCCVQLLYLQQVMSLHDLHAL